MTHYWQDILTSHAKYPKVQKHYYAISGCEIGEADPFTCKHNLVTRCMVQWNNSMDEFGNVGPPSVDYRAMFGVPPLQRFALFLPNEEGEHSVCNLCGSINLDGKGFREWSGKKTIP